jgi:hypothetical protein
MHAALLRNSLQPFSRDREIPAQQPAAATLELSQPRFFLFLSRYPDLWPAPDGVDIMVSIRTAGDLEAPGLSHREARARPARDDV